MFLATAGAMGTLIADLRYGARALVRRPGIALAAIVTLALGIGASTAVYSVVDAVLLRDLPFRDAERLVMVWERPPAERASGRERNVVNLGNVRDWEEQSGALRDLAVFFDTSAALGGDGEPEQVPAQLATSGLFTTLGVEPLLGRTFGPGDGAEGAPTSVILGHGLWQRRFAGDPSVIGRTVLVNGRDAVIVGVMRPGFSFHIKEGSMTRASAELWTAWQPGDAQRQRRGRFAMAVARLAPGASVESAGAEMSAIGARLAAAYPDFNAGWGVTVVPLHEQLSGTLRPSLLILLGAVVFLLLIACANVANLLLARAAGRSQEMSVRVALGAGRGRIIRQLLTESVLLAVLGGLAGVALAAWGLEALLALSPPELGDLPAVSINLPVLGFSLAVSVAVGVLFGLAPALAASRVDLHAVLRSARSGGGRHRVRDVLVVAEVALALMLLVGAGLLTRSFSRLAAVDPGFDPADVLTMRVTLPGSRYDTPEKTLAFTRQLTERLAALPGVQATGAISALPFATPPAGTRMEIEGEAPRAPGEEWVTKVSVATSGYFAAMRIPLERGRLFSPDEEHTSRQVVVVNQAFARAHFPGQDPLGRRVTIYMKAENTPSTIVGVVGDSKQAALGGEVEPMAYWPHPELDYRAMSYVIRAPGSAGLAAAARAAVAELDGAQPAADVRPMTSLLGRSLAGARFHSLLLAIFAAVSLVLAAVGIAGVMAVAVGQRAREIGIRMALGARPRGVVGLVVRRGMALVGIGVIVGVAGALLLGRVLDSLLFSVSSTDPVTIALVVAGLLVVALLASLIPARRAARVDPMVALRSE